MNELSYSWSFVFDNAKNSKFIFFLLNINTILSIRKSCTNISFGYLSFVVFLKIFTNNDE